MAWDKGVQELGKITTVSTKLFPHISTCCSYWVTVFSMLVSVLLCLAILLCNTSQKKRTYFRKEKTLEPIRQQTQVINKQMVNVYYL